MGFRDDERGQPVLIGFILLFGILVLAFASYQAFVVPSQNAGVEFNHNQEVQTDMQDLRNSLLGIRSVEDGEIVSEHRPVRVRLGTQYPARLIALNPPPASGSLTTEDSDRDVSFENAAVTGNYDGDPQDVLLDTDHETQFLTYKPSYSEFADPPDTALEHSLLYNDFQDATRTVREQRLIQGDQNRLRIILFDGDISRSETGAVTLDPETLDGPTAPVRIAAEDTDDPIELNLPTQAPDTWIDSIGTTYTDGEENARITDSSPDHVVIELDPDEEYTLRMARVGFDGGTENEQFTDIQPVSAETDSDSTFDTRWIEADGESIEDGTATAAPGDEFVMVAEALERGTTTPIQDAAVEFTIEGGVDDIGEIDRESPSDDETDEDGQARASVEVTDDAEDGDEFNVYVTIGDNSDVVTILVEEGEEEMAAQTEYVADSGEDVENDGIVDFDLENTGDTQVEIEGITVDSTTDNQADRVNNNGGREFDGAGGFVNLEGEDGFIEIGDPEVTSLDENAAIDGQSTETFRLEQFRRDDGDSRNLNRDDLTLTVYFTDGSELTFTAENL